jgi:hypothetical protein
MTFRQGVRTLPGSAAKAQEQLFGELMNSLRSVADLAGRIASHITAQIHAPQPDSAALFKECEEDLVSFRQLSSKALFLKATIDDRLREIALKGENKVGSSIPATQLQTVMMLHLVSEQTMGRRLEELRDIERRHKETIAKLENGLKMLYEHFEELANRLNLLCHMRRCLEEDGVLPANIMYQQEIPKVVSSPFSISRTISVHSKIQEAPASRGQGVVHYQQDGLKDDLEKKKAFLLQLREQYRATKEQGRKS